MTDDIVTRLLNEADYWCFDVPVRIFLDAVDEIERLRKELRDLQIAYAKHTDELEKELTVTKFQLAYWREIALENQTNGYLC